MEDLTSRISADSVLGDATDQAAGSSDASQPRGEGGSGKGRGRGRGRGRGHGRGRGNASSSVVSRSKSTPVISLKRLQIDTETDDEQKLVISDTSIDHERESAWLRSEGIKTEDLSPHSEATVTTLRQRRSRGRGASYQESLQSVDEEGYATERVAKMKGGRSCRKGDHAGHTKPADIKVATRKMVFSDYKCPVCCEIFVHSSAKRLHMKLHCTSLPAAHKAMFISRFVVKRCQITEVARTVAQERKKRCASLKKKSRKRHKVSMCNKVINDEVDMSESVVNSEPLEDADVTTARSNDSEVKPESSSCLEDVDTTRSKLMKSGLDLQKEVSRSELNTQQQFSKIRLQTSDGTTEENDKTIPGEGMTVSDKEDNISTNGQGGVRESAVPIECSASDLTAVREDRDTSITDIAHRSHSQLAEGRKDNLKQNNQDSVNDLAPNGIDGSPQQVAGKEEPDAQERSKVEVLISKLKQVHSATVKSYTCSICHDKFTRYVHFRCHCLLQHGMQWQCRVCRKSFLGFRLLMLHYRVSHSHLVHIRLPGLHSCNRCGRQFRHDRVLQNHRAQQHGTYPSAASSLKCRHCGRVYKYHRALLIHLIEHGLSEEEIKLEFVDPSKVPLRRAMVGGSLKKNEFTCPVCSKQFGTNHHMRGHMSLKHKLPVTKAYLMRRMNIAESGKTLKEWTCPESDCSFVGLTMLQLKLHMIDNHPHIMYHCKLCQFKTPIEAQVAR